jgi:hypothetical protein
MADLDFGAFPLHFLTICSLTSRVCSILYFRTFLRTFIALLGLDIFDILNIVSCHLCFSKHLSFKVLVLACISSLSLSHYIFIDFRADIFFPL